VVKPRQASRDVGLFNMESKMPGHTMEMGKGDKKMSDVIKKEMKAGEKVTGRRTQSNKADSTIAH